MLEIHQGEKRILQETLTDKAEAVRKTIREADTVIIGAGA